MEWHERRSNPPEGIAGPHRATGESWGPYVSERAWGTVREDYSANGEAWDYFPMIMPVRARIAGARMGWRESATAISGFASRWRCGMGAIRS